MELFPTTRIADTIRSELYSDYLTSDRCKTHFGTEHQHDEKTETCKFPNHDTLSLWELSALTIMELESFHRKCLNPEFDPVKEMMCIIHTCETISIMRVNGNIATAPVLNTIAPKHRNGLMYKSRDVFIDNICAYVAHAQMHARDVKTLRNDLKHALPKTITPRMILDVSLIVQNSVSYLRMEDVSRDRAMIIAFAANEFVSLSLDPVNNVY